MLAGGGHSRQEPAMLEGKPIPSGACLLCAGPENSTRKTCLQTPGLAKRERLGEARRHAETTAVNFTRKMRLPHPLHRPLQHPLNHSPLFKKQRSRIHSSWKRRVTGRFRFSAQTPRTMRGCESMQAPRRHTLITKRNFMW